MERLNEITVLALLLINIVAFAAYGIDKRKAKKGKWRIHQALSQAILVQKRKNGESRLTILPEMRHANFFSTRRFRHNWLESSRRICVRKREM